MTMNETSGLESKPAPALQQVLESRAGKRRMKPGWWLAILVAVGAIAWFELRPGQPIAAPNFVTEEARVGNLVVKVSATGNLQPTNTVDVGSELSGIVDKVWVDDNDQVKKGQVLAQLDMSKLEDAVAVSRASLVAAEAKVLQMQATLAETEAALARYRQVSKLSNGKVPSQLEMDTASANLKRAQANLASADADVAQAKAKLRSDETSLYKASIRSPIDGVVLLRQVDPGQTVAASLQAPVLFTLAEDLTKMELQVKVDEADVGWVKAGQQALFTVDAWPGRHYQATISRVGYGSTESEGVISYLTILKVDNDDLSLRPGMTGTAEITTLALENALLVPNAALRFAPPEQDASAKPAGPGLIGALMPRPPPMQRKQQPNAGEAGPRLWVLQDGQMLPLEVQTGATNGRVTQITGGGLTAGALVITEILEAKP